VEHVAQFGKKRNAYRLLVRNPEEKRSLERPRSRWVLNIKMDLWRDMMGGGGVLWISLVQYRDKWSALVNAVMKLRVP
jgi:hypothetical protein